MGNVSQSLPSKGESLAVLAGCTLFLAVTAAFIGLRTDHCFFTALFCVFYFASPQTRKLAMALLPFAAFYASYDWMRVVPNYTVNTVDTRPLYEAELACFGIDSGGSRIIPCAWFCQHNWPIVDLLAGLFYLCWVPVPMAFGLWLYFRGQRQEYLRFSLAFLFVNLLGFAGYYIHPAAPPWYVLEHGFDPVFSTPGNVAGLARFESLTGISVFSNIYCNNSNIFAAMPSLHAAYVLIATTYSLLTRQSRTLTTMLAVVTIGIWFTAVYTCHHYIIDVIFGILTALIGIWLFEQSLLRIAPFRRFVLRYVRYIT